MNSLSLSTNPPSYDDRRTYTFGLDRFEEAKSYLQEHGFVVLERVLDEDLATRALHGLYDCAAELIGEEGEAFRADWKKRRPSKNWPGTMNGGMCQVFGHLPVQWEVRMACRPVFERLYGVDCTADPGALRTSMDGYCLMDGARDYQTKPADENMHVDVALPNVNVYPSRMVQGVANLCDSLDPQSGGFVCVPRAWKQHASLLRALGRHEERDNWIKFTPAQREALYARVGQRPIRVYAESGSMILWYSETPHCNTIPAPIAQPDQDNTRVHVRNTRIRAVTYVCMAPPFDPPAFLSSGKSGSTKRLKGPTAASLQTKRLEALEQRRCTAHWPWLYFKCFSRYPHAYGPQGDLRPRIDAILARPLVLPPEALALVG